MPVSVTHGDSPLILALPYTGTDMMRATMKRLADPDMLFSAPDRHLDQLTESVAENISVVRARFHRFLADVDFPYPANASTPVAGMLGVVPLVDRFGARIWDTPPSVKEAASWRSMCFAPYHAALAAQIARVRARAGHAILLTCHARPEDEALSEDAYPPDIRMSSFMGASAAIGLTARITALLKTGNSLTVSLDGRRPTGGSTRRYGRPRQGVHAIDLEFNERNYLGKKDRAGLYDAELAGPLRTRICELFAFLKSWRPE